MEGLPDELMLMILERLPVGELYKSAALVCQRWRKLCEALELQATVAKHLEAIGRNTRALFVIGWVPSCSLSHALSLSENLRELTVHVHCPLSSDQIFSLHSLRHLRHLDVFASRKVYGPELVPVARRLRSLVLNEHAAPGVLGALAVNSAPLQAVHMYGRAQYFPPRDLCTLLRAHAHTLVELTLRCCELPESGYIAIGLCQQLEVLKLYSSWMLTGARAVHVGKGPRLRCLHVTGAHMLRRKALAVWLCGLNKQLQELVLSSGAFADEHVALLVERCLNLRTIELWRCRISSSGLLELAAQLPELRDLDSDVALSDVEVRVLRTHPKLQRLRHAGRSQLVGSLKVVNFRDTPDALFRGGTEGYRGELLHYSQRETHLY